MTRDLDYELDLLDRLNRASVDGVSLLEYPKHEAVARWHRFQQAIFAYEVRTFAQTRSFAAYKEIAEKARTNRVKMVLMSCVAFMLLMLGWLTALFTRPKILIFSVDKVSDPRTKSDFRISGIYRVLDKYNISYIECFHSTVGSALFLNFLKRGRQALYLEAIDVLWYAYRSFSSKSSGAELAIDHLSGSSEEVAFMRYVIKKYLAIMPLMEYRRRVLKRIFAQSGIQMILGIDDARHYHEVLEAGAELGIPSAVVQHGLGHFTRYHPGWLMNFKSSKKFIRADYLLVTNQHWKDELRRLNSVYQGEAIVVAGSQKVSSMYPFATKRIDPTNDKLIVLVPHEVETPKDEISSALVSLSRCANVYLKLRPDVGREEQLRGYTKEALASVNIVTAIEEVPIPDAVVGVYSSFLYEMIEARIPVAVLESSVRYGEGIVHSGLGERLASDPDMCAKLREVAQVPLQTLGERAQRMHASSTFDETLIELMKEKHVL